ncbi:hypothetical protein BJY52DRAFT_1205065 [Lactarius psammicola]|nr:hypothetical protein BJY52DRAFT_1205065 [Lactarius psammicola]
MPKASESPGKNKKCQICHNRFRVQGYSAHIKKCARERDERRGERKYARALEKRLRSLDTLTREPTPPSVAQTTGSSGGPRTHKFTVEYHPKSGRASETRFLDEDNRRRRLPNPSLNAEPWRPFFKSREDFVFSDVLMEVGMSKDQYDRLYKALRTSIDGKGPLSLLKYSEMRGAWERASSQLTPVSPRTTFAMPHRPLWNWAVDLILDPQLAPHFEWDAQKVFKHDGENVTRVYDEPWTADTFWNFQSQIPEGARPLCFILYADKAKLSSFGTEMAYPVVARCANLPTEIRNGHGVGGGRVVGWLPNVPETPEDSKKPAFINFKREVWHRAFRCIIESIIEKSKAGCWLQYADGTQHLFFPSIIILSADYEEQCVMSLIRGYLGKLPCPICCVPKDQLADNSKTWPLRTAAHVKQILREVRALSKSDRESHLSKHGIRDVNNVFWLVNNSDPHRALSFDRLHSNNAGLFGHHLWQRFKDLVSRNRDAAAKVDQQFGRAPRWRGLNHFPEVMKVSFTDGAKFEDISKVVVFAAQNIIQRSEDKEGWQLLLCLRSFSILDLLLSFEVHTEKTIMAGRNELARFGRLMKVRDWNYPKMHALVHSFDDIEAKGASRNYNTKPNEKLHGPIRKLYNRTNFKNVASQILNREHLGFVAALIRNQIDELDLDAAAQPPAHDSSSYQRRNTTFDAGVVILRSQQRPVTLEAVGDLAAQNPTFKNFRVNLADWLTANLPLYGFSFAPGSMRVEFQADDQITEYRSMKVCYESKVDWQQYLDYLYCSPGFHGRERHDFVILKTTTGFIFAQLVFIFTISVAERKYPLCMVRPLDIIPTGQSRVSDRDLRLRRLRARQSTEFFFAQSIVRGAPLIQDFAKLGDYFVMDVVDHTGDLFLRCDEIFGW